MNANIAAARVLKRTIAAAYHDHVDYGHHPGQSVESSTQQGKPFRLCGDENGDSTDPYIQNDVDGTCRSDASARREPNV